MMDITARQAGQFREDGFLIVDRILDGASVKAARSRYEPLFRGEFETGIRPDEVNWQEGKSDPSLTRQLCNVWKSDRTIASIILREHFGRTLAQLMGWPGARIMIDNVLWKPVGARSLGFHQDSAYLRWFRPTDLCSLWMALDDTTAEGGAMELVRGSHRWERSYPEGEFHGPENYRAPMEKTAAEMGVEPEIAPVAVKKGGGSFHHGWTWHGSGPNRGASPRRALVLHAMSSEVEFCPECISEGIGPIYGRYKKFGTNEMDDNFFPVLWHESGYRTPGLDEFCRSAVLQE